MPLKPCRECGREVATDARTCPQCGTAAPTDTEAQYATGKAFRTIVLVAAVIVLLLWMTASGWFG